VFFSDSFSLTLTADATDRPLRLLGCAAVETKICVFKYES